MPPVTRPTAPATGTSQSGSVEHAGSGSEARRRQTLGSRTSAGAGTGNVSSGFEAPPAGGLLGGLKGLDGMKGLLEQPAGGLLNGGILNGGVAQSGGVQSGGVQSGGVLSGGVLSGGLLALTNGTGLAKLLPPDPRQQAQDAIGAVKAPASDHPYAQHITDLRADLAKEGLPTSAEGVRLHVMDSTEPMGSSGDSHGAQVTRAAAGPVGTAPGADVLLNNHRDPTKASGSYQPTAAQVARMNEVKSLEQSIKSGDAGLDDLGRYAALVGERALHEKRADLAHVADSIPEGHDQTTVMNMSYGQSLARASSIAGVHAFDAPKGSRLDKALREATGKGPEQAVFPADIAKVTLPRAKALTQEGELHESIAEARAALTDELAAARGKGVFVVRAAGNEADEAARLGDPSASKTFSDGIPGMLTVGATHLGADPSTHTDDGVSTFSSHGAVDVSAPGVQVPVKAGQKPKGLFGGSLNLGGLGQPGSIGGLLGGQAAGEAAAPPPKPEPLPAAGTNGTSFSSPYVAGVAALMVKANPSITPDQLEQILTSKAVASDLAGTRDGNGALDVVAAVKAAKALAD